MRFLGIFFIFQAVAMPSTCIQELGQQIAKDNGHFVQFSKLTQRIIERPSDPRAAEFAKQLLLTFGSLGYQEISHAPTAELNVPRSWVRKLLSGTAAQTARTQTRLRRLIEAPDDEKFGYYVSGKQDITTVLSAIDYRDLSGSYLAFLMASVMTRTVFPLAIISEVYSPRLQNPQVREEFIVFFSTAAAVVCCAMEAVIFAIDSNRSCDNSKFFTQVNYEIKRSDDGKIVYQGFDLPAAGMYYGRTWHFDFMFRNSDHPEFAFFVSK